MRVRISKLIFLLSLIAASAAIARASCIGPIISASAKEGPANGKLVITGKYFTDDCHDVCFDGVCPPTFPAKNIKVLFVQGNNTKELARVDANKQFEIDVTVTIPKDAQVGAASVVVETLYGRSVLRPTVPFTVTSEK